MKLPPGDIAVRREIISEAAKIAEIYDRILVKIRRCESEKQVQKALKKLRIHMETFEKEITHLIGRQN